MVSEKPPRHSKSKAEPVTIDLDAKDVKAIGVENQTTDAANKATAPVAAKPDVTAKDTNPSPIWDQATKVSGIMPDKTPIEPEPNVNKLDDGQTFGEKPKTEPKTESVANKSVPPVSEKPATTASANAAASSTRDPVQPRNGPDKPFTTTAKPASASEASLSSPTQSTVRKEAPTSGLIAAGIVGGIIALAAAGSMQYAGYLPPFAGGGTQHDAITSITADIGSLRNQINNTTKPTADTSALEARLAALEGGSGTGGAEVTALSEKVASLENTIATLQSERSAQASATSDLTRRLGEAETKINEPRDDVEVARAIASAALKAAIDRGGPFLTELDTLSRVAQDDPGIASLRPFAATGVPSRAELMRDYPDVANAMLSALNQPDPNQGIFDRLSESALSLVKVRPVGNIEGESPDAIVARMENKLRNGDLQGAALEWNALPEPAKSVSTAYKKSLDARIEVENLVSGTLNRAISATGKQG